MRPSSGLLACLLLAIGCSGSAAQEMKPPRLWFAPVDWPAAIATLGASDTPRPAPTAAKRRSGNRRAIDPALARLNMLMTPHFAGIAESVVPVLLPFDVDGFTRDLAEDTGPSDDDRYTSSFHAAKLFYAGPAGYDAAFALRVSDIPELADSKLSDPVEVQISGSRVLYELDTPLTAEGQPVASLEAEFPGMRRLMIEHSVRYAFTRFGVPYIVSVPCFDTNRPRYKLPTCHAADHVAQRFLRALRLVGGSPRNLAAAQPLPADRPARVSRSFGYYAPGALLTGSGFRGGTGRQDYTVYAQVRFPLADVPVYAHSEVFRNRDRMRVSDIGDTPNISYAWRDNFCERRGFPVSQCPAGIGHQGQDIRPAGCKLIPGTERCEQHGDVVAVRDGAILRAPKQEAAYLFVNTANEHIRFRYLHMIPQKMDAANLLSGRRVDEGEVIGEVGNYSMKSAGTSYHLHFDAQVLTRKGWVFVNPYMTLVSAYERQIDARGTELADPVLANAEAASTGMSPPREKAARHRRHYVGKAQHRARPKQRVQQAQR